MGSDSIRFSLFPWQQKAWNARQKRRFEPALSEREMLDRVNGAVHMHEVADMLVKFGVCDLADLSDFNIETAKKLAVTVIRVSFVFPRIRSILCFLGSKSSYIRALQRLCLADKKTIEDFGIEKICSDKLASQLGTHGINMVDSIKFDDKNNNVLATAVSLAGIVDAVILDEDDFRGLSYKRLCSNLEDNERSGFHPKGCGTPESVIYHEFGHMIDYLCRLTESKEFLTYFKTLTRSDIEDGLSEYAATSSMEMFAEAFAEHMCNPRPREMARVLWGMLSKYYDAV